MKLSKKIGQFTAVPTWVLDKVPEIGLDGLAMYVYLLTRQGSNGSCFPSYDKMQEDLNVSRAKLSRLIKILLAAGLIEKQRRFSASTIYTVISSENELMQFNSSENELSISSEIEPPLVQNLDANQIQLNRFNREGENAAAMLLSQMTGLPPTPADLKAIDQLPPDFTADDVAEALQWRKDNARPPVKTIAQLIPGINTSYSKRVQNNNARPAKKTRGKKEEHWVEVHR